MRPGRISEEGIHKAKRALSVFRSMQPTLNAYARMITGRADIMVVEAAQSNGHTDGKKIYYRPPIGLGEQITHEKWACDKRNEDGLPLCPACAQREAVLVTVYHEIAHIWMDSFEPAGELDQAYALREAVREHGTKYADKLRDVLARAPYSVRNSYMGLANLVSPYLPKIINALEDARVNRGLFKAMPGTKQMFDANTKSILRNGVEQLDRSGDWGLVTWDTYPLNAQVVCGLFCKSSEYDYALWFHRDVVAALDDEQITNLIKQNNRADSVSTVYGLAFPILARLRELGFCKADTDPEDEEEPPPPPPDAPGDPGEDEESAEDDGTGEPGDDPGDDATDGDPGEDGDDRGGVDSGASEEGAGDDSSSSVSGGRDPGDGESDTSEDSERRSPEDDTSGSGDPSGDPEEAEAPGDADRDDDRGDVDDDSTGSTSSDSETEGSSGSEDGDPELGGDSGRSDERGGDDPGGESDLAEDSGDSGEGGPDLPGAKAGESSSWTDPTAADAGVGDESDAPSVGDADDDLGGSDRLDSADGEDIRPESDDSSRSSTGSGDEDDDERIDTGPFTKGTRLIVDEDGDEEVIVEADDEDDRPEMGTPEDVEIALLKMGDHEPPDSVFGHSHDDDLDIDLMKLAIIQGMYFETPSVQIHGVQHYNFPDILHHTTPDQVPAIETMTGGAWHYSWVRDPSFYVRAGITPHDDSDSFDPPLEVLTEATMKARIAFADNLRGGYTPNHKSGRVNPRHLGKRAPVDDPRIMRRKIKATKKSYFVVIGIDVSGSTMGENVYLAKKLAMAECEMLNDLGVRFAVYAHSGGNHSRTGAPDTGLTGMHLHIYNVKLPDEPWTDKVRHKLRSLGPDAANLDGHTMEYYRRILERERETVKILHYYTDGAMPAENHDEELAVLTREIQTFRRKGMIVLGVGIRTDAPRQHGLETAEVHEVKDIIKVIAHLERELTKH